MSNRVIIPVARLINMILRDRFVNCYNLHDDYHPANQGRSVHTHYRIRTASIYILNILFASPHADMAYTNYRDDTSDVEHRSSLKITNNR